MLSNRDLFAGTVDPFVTTLVILLTDLYTNKETGEIEWLNWDIETIKMELEDDLRIKIKPRIIDKIAVGQLLMTTDLFYKTAPDFIHFCNVMNDDNEMPGVWNPADSYEIAWAVAEATLLEPPEKGLPDAFSPEVLGYIKIVLKQANILSAPDSLSFIKPDELSGPAIGQLSDDMVLYKAAYDEAQEGTDMLNEYVNMRTTELLDQLSQITVRKGNLKQVVDQAKAQIEPQPEQFFMQA